MITLLCLDLQDCDAFAFLWMINIQQSKTSVTSNSATTTSVMRVDLWTSWSLIVEYHTVQNRDFTPKVFGWAKVSLKSITQYTESKFHRKVFGWAERSLKSITQNTESRYHTKKLACRTTNLHERFEQVILSLRFRPADASQVTKQSRVIHSPGIWIWLKYFLFRAFPANRWMALIRRCLVLFQDSKSWLN